MLIIAHRGASAHAPENTLEAFRLAWTLGADAIETDLRRTADGVIVAFHDADTRRILRPPGRIAELTRAELDPVVPSLEAVLSTVPPHGHVVLELKEPLVPDLRTFPPERVTLIAFDAAVLVAAKRALPACRALWLFGDYRALPSPAALATRVNELGVDGVDLRFSRSLRPALLDPLRADGRTIFTYTVNTARGVAECARLGLDGLTTDRPGDARRWLE